MSDLWNEYHRVVKKNGAIVLTSQGPFTSQLIESNPKYFKYKLVWLKSKATNFLNSKKQPLRKHEDICVFYRKQPDYTPQMGVGDPYDKGVRKNQLSGSYGDFKPKHVKSEGKRYPTDVIYFATAEAEGKIIHATQKPVELGRYLIRTYSNEGDLILDNTFGSGSFLLSAALENRKFCGIEMNDDIKHHKTTPRDYIAAVEERIKEKLPHVQVNIVRKQSD